MGVEKEIVSAGDGKLYPQKADKVTMHYIGTLMNGKEFDSSRSRGQPWVCRIGIGEVIKGWEEAIVKMSLGERAVLTITSDYGYGTVGFRDLIPPDSTLIFDVELLAINDTKAPNYPK